MTSQQKFNRKSPRLQDFDYAQHGGYFITICTHNRQKLFGTIDTDGIMHNNQWGQIALLYWDNIPQHFPNVQLDEFVVMPNHIHGILFIIEEQQAENKSTVVSDVGAIHELQVQQADSQNQAVPSVGERHASPLRKPYRNYRVQSGSIITVVSSYKSAVTRQINKMGQKTTPFVWQRSFHDHIIRNETELNKLREYVFYNPALWAADRYHTD